MLQMHKDTARTKIHRYNEQGIAGLQPNYKGKTSALTPEHRQKLRTIIVEWNAPEQGISVLQGHDIKKLIEQNYGLIYHRNSIYRLLKEMGLSLLRPRPRHPKGNSKKQAEFCEQVPIVRAALQEEHIKKTEIWFFDESRFGLQGILRRRWSPRGERMTLLKQMEYEWTYLYGAGCPESGQGCALVLPEVNTEMMNKFLKLLAVQADLNVHVLLIMDNAAWHHSKSLVVPQNITPMFLPPYSPELNPIERVWNELKGRYIANRTYKSLEKLIDKICVAWN